MSVYYDVKEYLEVQEITEENREILYFTQEHLAWLGWKILKNSAKVINITFLCGEKKVTFSGDTMNADFHNMIRALEEERSFQLTMEYQYCWRALDPEMSYDHLAISSYLDRVQEEETKHIFYTMYNDADCGDGAGILSAYGERNGHAYKGIVQDKHIPDFPDSGNWYAPRETVIYEPNEIDHVDLKAIGEVIQELSTLSEGDNIVVSENELSYFMNNFQPKNSEDFKKFVHLAGRLIELTNGECYICAELVDLDDPFGRIIKIDVTDSKKYTITMASID